MNRSLLREAALEAPARKPAPAARQAPSMRLPDGMVLEVITQLDALEAIEADWSALHAAVGRPAHLFQHFNWCWHWCRHYLGAGRSGIRLVVVTGRKAGRLELVVPLAAERLAGLVELTWLGEPVSQYGDVLATPEAADPGTLLAAWRLAVAHAGADVANLRRVREDAIVAPLLAQLGARITATEEAPHLELAGDASHAAWEERRQPKHRRNRRRQARRLGEIGPVGFAAVTRGPEAGRLAAEAVRRKRETLDAKGAISLAMADPRFEAFFHDAAAGLGRPTPVSVLALTVGDRTAALEIVLESETATLLHVAVYDPELEKCGPGGILLDRAIARSIECRRTTFDLLPPRHDYKMEFADGVMLVHDHALALSRKGWLYKHVFLRVRRHVKAVVERLPAGLRRGIIRLVR